MKYPNRPPLERQSYHLGLSYYDHETSVQGDGKIASFFYDSNKHNEGWQFSHYEDKYGFRIWEEKDHKAKWDENTTIEQLLLESKDLNPHYKENFEIADDEEIHAYVYGGILAERGGWFVVKKDNPNKIIRSKQTWLS